MNTYELVEQLNSIRKGAGVRQTPALLYNSRSQFHKWNYLRELERIELDLLNQIEAVREMKKIVRKVK